MLGNIHRQMVRGACVALCLAVAPALAAFPDGREIRLVVPYPAGGPTDAIARSFAQEFSHEIGAPVVVENKAGADTMIGTRQVLAAPADGYTLLMGTTAVGTTEIMHRDTGFTLSDFKAIAPFGFQGFILSTSTAESYSTLPQLIAAAKSREGGLNNASLAEGSPVFFMAERLKNSAGIPLTHVRFAGSTPAMNAVAGGHVQIIFNGPLTTMPMLNAGKLRAIAVTTEKRLPMLPDVPTFKELGYPDVTGAAWSAVMAPAKTPAPVMEMLIQAGRRASQSDSVKRVLANIAIQPWSGSLESFDETIRADRELWLRDAKRLGIKPQ